MNIEEMIKSKLFNGYVDTLADDVLHSAFLDFGDVEGDVMDDVSSEISTAMSSIEDEIWSIDVDALREELDNQDDDVLLLEKIKERIKEIL